MKEILFFAVSHGGSVSSFVYKFRCDFTELFLESVRMHVFFLALIGS